jgi:hypothetical protein
LGASSFVLSAGGIPAGSGAGTAFEAATGLRLTRASAGTVQTGTATVDITPATDYARIGRRLDADTLALVLEVTRTNILVYSRLPAAGSGWNAASIPANTTYLVATGPDGTATISPWHQTESVGFSNYQSPAITNGQPYTAALWRKSPNVGGTLHQWYIYNGSAAAYQGGTIPNSWARTSLSMTAAAASGQYQPCSGQNGLSGGGIAAGARNAYTDLHQMELGKYSTEAIITAGAPVTRSPDRLWHPNAALITDLGRFSPCYRFRPKAASTDYATDMYLWNYDANNAAWIKFDTRTLNVKVAGATWTSTALTWALGDTVDLQIAAGGGVLQTLAKYRVNGGAAQSLGTTAAQAAFSPTGALDLMCNGTSNCLTSYLERIDYYKSGQVAQWAA